MTEKELIMIPCSGRKTPEGFHSSEGRQIKGDLQPSDARKLEKLRKKVADSFNISLDSPEQSLLPAYKRYSGNLYKKISEQAWKELDNREDVELVIISALYGVIYWDEPIIHYDIELTDPIKSRRRLNTWWKKKGLTEILSNYIEGEKYDVVRSFLSGNYRKALLDLEDKVDPICLLYEYPSLGSGSNYYRGKDIDDAILDRNIVCPDCNSKKTRRISRKKYGCVSCGKEYKV